MKTLLSVLLLILITSCSAVIIHEPRVITHIELIPSYSDYYKTYKYLFYTNINYQVGDTLK